MPTENHDNTNVKISNSFNGNIVLVGGGLSSVVLLVFAVTHWTEAIVLSSVLVYGILSVIGLIAAAAVVALWVRFVVIPVREARSLENEGKILHTQDNAIVIVNGLGNVEVIPLFAGSKSTIVESDPNQEMHIVAMEKAGVRQQLIADGLQISQSTVSRIVNKHKDKNS
jgi:hypothetical protein